jgi:hypothetical protein
MSSINLDSSVHKLATVLQKTGVVSEKQTSEIDKKIQAKIFTIDLVCPSEKKGTKNTIEQRVCALKLPSSLLQKLKYFFLRALGFSHKIDKNEAMEFYNFCSEKMRAGQNVEDYGLLREFLKQRYSLTPPVDVTGTVERVVSIRKSLTKPLSKPIVTKPVSTGAEEPEPSLSVSTLQVSEETYEPEREIVEAFSKENQQAFQEVVESSLPALKELGLSYVGKLFASLRDNVSYEINNKYLDNAPQLKAALEKIKASLGPKEETLLTGRLGEIHAAMHDEAHEEIEEVTGKKLKELFAYSKEASADEVENQNKVALFKELLGLFREDACDVMRQKGDESVTRIKRLKMLARETNLPSDDKNMPNVEIPRVVKEYAQEVMTQLEDPKGGMSELDLEVKAKECQTLLMNAALLQHLLPEIHKLFASFTDKPLLGLKPIVDGLSRHPLGRNLATEKGSKAILEEVQNVNLCLNTFVSLNQFIEENRNTPTPYSSKLQPFVDQLENFQSMFTQENGLASLDLNSIIERQNAFKKTMDLLRHENVSHMSDVRKIIKNHFRPGPTRLEMAGGKKADKEGDESVSPDEATTYNLFMIKLKSLDKIALPLEKKMDIALKTAVNDAGFYLEQRDAINKALDALANTAGNGFAKDKDGKVVQEKLSSLKGLVSQHLPISLYDATNFENQKRALITALVQHGWEYKKAPSKHLLEKNQRIIEKPLKDLPKKPVQASGSVEKVFEDAAKRIVLLPESFSTLERYHDLIETIFKNPENNDEVRNKTVAHKTAVQFFEDNDYIVSWRNKETPDLTRAIVTAVKEAAASSGPKKVDASQMLKAARDQLESSESSEEWE